MSAALALSLAVLTASPAPGVGTLVDRIADRSARMQWLEGRLAQTCTDRAEHLDGDGKPEQVFVETVRSVKADGIERKQLLSAAEDGVDVTAREQEKQAEEAGAQDGSQERGNYGGIDFSNPFTPAGRRVYRFSLAPKQPGDGDRVRIHFEPKGEKTSSLYTGEALVDPDGNLVEITAHPSDYPAFVDFVHFDARYAVTELGPVRTDFSVEGAGGFLFIQKHYRESLHCSDFAVPEGTLSTR